MIFNGFKEKENIFHTQWYVPNKMCSLIIDSRSYPNMANIIFVSKLKLCNVKHVRCYILQWLNDSSEVKMTKQVVVLFFNGKYIDEVIYDVVPM